MNRSFVLALSTLVGTIIGAGFFGVPFVVAKSGFVPAVFYFLVLGAAVTLLHLFFGEIALRTKKRARLIGYSAAYLGNLGKGIATLSTLFGIVGALLVYVIIGGSFLHILLGEIVGVSSFWFSILFWMLLSLFIVRGIQLIAKAEFFMNIMLFVTIFVVFLFAAPHIKVENFSLIHMDYVFLPYGVILFGLAGWSAIPEIADFFKSRKEKRTLDNLIVWAGVITTLLSFVFSLFVVGVSGKATSPDALQGLIPFLGKEVIALGAVFGLVAIAASSLVLGNYLKNSLRHDFNLSYMLSVGIAVFSPIALFLLGFREFIAVLGLVGIVIGIVEGTLIVLAYQKAKKLGDRSPEYSLRIPQILPYLVLFVIIGGAIAELFFTYAR